MQRPQSTLVAQFALDLNATSPPSIVLDQLTPAELRYLRGPIIQPRNTGWDFPDQLRGIIPAARWLQIMRGRDDEPENDLASEEEAVGYLSCVSLDAPLSRDWAEIFFYLGQQVFPRWGMIRGQTVHEALGLECPVTLNPMQLDDLRRFRRWLRRKVEENAPRELRQFKKQRCKSNG